MINFAASATVHVTVTLAAAPMHSDFAKVLTRTAPAIAHVAVTFASAAHRTPRIAQTKPFQTHGTNAYELQIG